VETPAESTENSEPVVNVETAATAEVTAEVISEAIEVATEAVEEPKSPTKEDA
jgi:hypothetical protein